MVPQKVGEVQLQDNSFIYVKLRKNFAVPKSGGASPPPSPPPDATCLPGERNTFNM